MQTTLFLDNNTVIIQVSHTNTQHFTSK